MNLGYIGNVFIVIFFSQQHQNACSIYLITSAIINILYLSFNGFVQYFPFYYRDETIRALILCKLRAYLGNFLGQSARIMIILACIDRFMFTSNRASFREFSTPKRAKYFVCFAIIFWSLFASHILILTTVVNGQCGTFGIYSIIYKIYSIVFVGLVPPNIVAIFGYLTYLHIRQIHNRARPIVNSISSENTAIIRGRDRTLLVIVMSESLVYFITITPYALSYLEVMISGFIVSNKSIQYLQIEHFLMFMTLLLLYINNTAPFYVYMISSKSFRRDFKQLIIKAYRKLTRQRTILRRHTTYQMMSLQETYV
jgi:hypothetical protein